MKRNFVHISLITIFLFYTSCQSKEEEEETEAEFMVTSPLMKDTSVVKEYVCQIRAIQHIELRALESAYLEQVFVDEGQFVKKGQLMFQLLPIQFKAELQKAEAEAQYVNIEYQNAKLLADSNVISAFFQPRGDKIPCP